MIATEKDAIFEAVQWAPDGERIACIAAMSNGPNEAGQRLIIVDAKSGKKTLVAVGATGPQWSPKSDSLSFFKRVPGGWKPQRAHGFKSGTSKLQLAALSETNYSLPGVFTKDASRFAILVGGDRIEIATPSGKTVQSFPLPTSIEPVSMQWSPDDRWLMVRGNDVAGMHTRPVMTFLIQPATGMVCLLEKELSAEDKPEVRKSTEEDEFPRKSIGVRVAEWMPGKEHRLLLLAGPMPSGYSGVAESVPDPEWMVYSLDDKTKYLIRNITPTKNDADSLNDSINGVDYLHDFEFVGGHHEFFWSPDGKYALMKGQRHQLEFKWK